MILEAHLDRQRRFSSRTFGPMHLRHRTAGVIDHIRKELFEIEENPRKLDEWIDVVILAFDGAMRNGYTSKEIVAALEAKQTKNENRDWPDWRSAAPGKAIEHVRSPEELAEKKRLLTPEESHAKAHIEAAMRLDSEES